MGSEGGVCVGVGVFGAGVMAGGAGDTSGVVGGGDGC